jgi:hypothetical protein
MLAQLERQNLFRELSDSIDRGALVEPAPELSQFAREERLGQQLGEERRRYRRFSLITNVIALPLDEGLRPVGQPFVGLSSGMSIGGIRLLHTDPLPSDYLFIEIDGQPVRFLLSVLRNRPIGPCCEIAGRFVDERLIQTTAGLAVRATEADRPGRVTASPGALAEIPPTVEELAHWAGVSDAVRLLKSSQAHRGALPPWAAITSPSR